MFMRVNAKCAHQVRPSVEPGKLDRRNGKNAEGSRSFDPRHIAES
jgi:hypothetical protein